MGAINRNLGFFTVTTNKIPGVNDVSGDMISMSKPELEEITDAANATLLLNRIAVRSKGYQVEALNKKSRSNEIKQNYAAGLDNDGGGNSGLDIEPHPELPYMGGKSDQIMLPDSNVDAVPESMLSDQQKQKRAEKNKKQQEKQRKELSNRMTNKIKFKNAPKHAPTNRYVAPPPRHTPPKLRPSGS